MEGRWGFGVERVIRRFSPLSRFEYSLSLAHHLIANNTAENGRHDCYDCESDPERDGF